ncbi:MAG: PIG-L deacetylase family protein [Aggregatilineales bacterium]
MQLEAPLKPPFRILIIAAHPDDIEFGAGGAAAVWSAAGATVSYCIVTNGAAGSNDVDIDYRVLVARRQEEQIEAARLVGVHDVHFLGYGDGTLEPTIALRRELTRLIRRLRPDRVVIMDPTTVLVQNDGFSYINHPDHRASAEAALYAVFPSAESRPIFPELLAEGLEPHHVNEVYLMLTEKANTAVDITEFVEQKYRALLAHRSQLDESVIDMVRSWDAAAGQQANVAYAELFRVMTFYPNRQREQAAAEAAN